MLEHILIQVLHIGTFYGLFACICFIGVNENKISFFYIKIQVYSKRFILMYNIIGYFRTYKSSVAHDLHLGYDHRSQVYKLLADRP